MQKNTEDIITAIASNDTHKLREIRSEQEGLKRYPLHVPVDGSESPVIRIQQGCKSEEVAKLEEEVDRLRTLIWDLQMKAVHKQDNVSEVPSTILFGWIE